MSDAKTANNGVNVQHLIGAKEALTATPAAAQFQWRATCEWKNGTHSLSTVEGDMNILGILGADPEVRNGYSNIRVNFDIKADASADDIAALVAQSQKRSAVFDALANPTNISVSVS